MHRRLATALALALAAVALAGCSGSPAADPLTPDAARETMTIVGLVQNETFAPIPGAHVFVRLTDLNASTDAGGLFTFTGLPLSPYVVDVVADGFGNATLTAEPRLNVSLTFILAPPSTETPPPVLVHFQGNLQCAFEAAIITPSCDTLIDETGQSLFEDISTFEAGVNQGWTGVVIDVDFDPSAHPGLAGLRLTLQGRNDADKLTTYEQYGRFYDSGPFSVLVQPGGTYEDGNLPVPANATSLQLEVYPHSHGYHPGGAGLLGAGAAMNVQFDLYVTAFYGPIPEGYTLLA